jgi:hypothetical protein
VTYLSRVKPKASVWAAPALWRRSIARGCCLEIAELMDELSGCSLHLLCILLTAWPSVLWLVPRAAVMFVGAGMARQVLEVPLPSSRFSMPMRALGELSGSGHVRCPSIWGEKAGSFLLEVETDDTGVLLGL